MRLPAGEIVRPPVSGSEPEQARLLKAVKARDGIPESEQIRRALAIWFEQKGVLKPKRKSS